MRGTAAPQRSRLEQWRWSRRGRPRVASYWRGHWPNRAGPSAAMSSGASSPNIETLRRCHRGPRGPSGRPSATVEPWPCAQRPTRKRPSPRGHQRRSRKPAQGLPRSSRLVKPNLRRRLPSPRQRINGIGPVVSAMHPRRWDLRHCTIKFVGYSQRLGHGGRALPKGACHRGPLCLQVDKTTLEPLGKLG